MGAFVPAIILFVALATGSPEGLFQGRLLDSAGEAVPGAVLEVRPAGEDAVVARATSGPDGRYVIARSASSRPVTITVTCPGFATITVGPLALDTADGMDITLHRSTDLEETVEVEGRGVTVPLERNQDTTTFGELAVEALPLVGRRLTDLLVLAPGVTDTDEDGRLHVRGARDTGLQLRLDGSNATNPLTGQFGQEVNLETIQEVQVITSGAPAEYGRADGGFAEVITKTGGNDVSGSLKVYHRSAFLDGDGANAERGEAPHFNDTSLYGTLGGPIARDRLWYFGSVQRIERETPVVLADGSFVATSASGAYSFLKLTWQADTLNKLSAQVNADPLRTLGNHISPTIAPETDYRLETGGPLYQLNWTSVLSPDLLLTALFSRLDSGQDIRPVSKDFEALAIERIPMGTTSAVALPCLTRNCQFDDGLHRFYREDTFGTRRNRGPVRERGPFDIRSDQTVGRTTLRSDVTYVKESAWGQHSIKSGFEANDEAYFETAIHNPTLTDRTCEFFDCNIATAPPPLGTRYGRMLLEAHDPVDRTMEADGLNLGFYVQDGWRIRPNLMLNIGLRVDVEAVDSLGRSPFDPLAESREALRRYDLVCEAAGSLCTNARTPGRRDGQLTTTITPAPGDPALELDRNGDGTLQTEEIGLINEPFTREQDLVASAVSVDNANLAPRMSLSWDPGADGKTRLSASFGRYYDRLLLRAVALEQDPVSFVAEWTLPGQHDQAEAGELSRPLTGAVSMSQVDRGLKTPHTDELSLGVERELAPEWSISLLYLDRKGRDLLQDVDRNHITCLDFDEAYGVDPEDVCGDGGGLELDRFGFVEVDQFESVTFHPNGAVDLYHLNPRFNQILRVENANSYEYRAVEARLRRRLHRNWQMEAAYTYSTAKGEAESFVDFEGNDPAVSDKASGYLDYDQRHIFKLQAVTHLRSGFLLGGTILWESGLPYSIVENLEDHDDASNITPQRIVPVTGRKNDQRNLSRVTLNAHLEKRLNARAAELTGFLDIENLLDSDDLRLREVDLSGQDAITGERRYGRRFQIGLGVIF